MPALSLREPQIPMVDWMRTHERCGMWAGMGIGKSSATLYTLDLLRLSLIHISEPTRRS